MEPAVVTVGLDGSRESLAAALWAADEAHRRQEVLRLLHAWILLAAEPEDTPPERDQNYWARRVVDEAAAAVHERYPDLRILEDLIGADAESALLQASRESRMLVMGSRALGTLGSYFLGDTSLNVVARAEGPVVLVRGEDRGDRPAPDGGPGTSGAPHESSVAVGLSLHGPCGDLLGFAFDEAMTRGLPLHVVHGRSLPAQAYAPWGVDPDVAAQVTAEAENELREVLRPWQAKFPTVRVRTTVLPRSPARAAVRAAVGAELLVVGRRRHHPHLTPRVGPVTHAAVHHVSCPVAVVPHD